jgi:hypothetical protein
MRVSKTKTVASAWAFGAKRESSASASESAKTVSA